MKETKHNNNCKIKEHFISGKHTGIFCECPCSCKAKETKQCKCKLIQGTDGKWRTELAPCHQQEEQKHTDGICQACRPVPLSKGWEEEFDEKFTCLGEKDVDPIFRYCRVDLPDGDSRSIKSFIEKTLLSERAKVVEETIREIYKICDDNKDVIAIYKYAAEKGIELNEKLSLTEKHK